MIRADDGSTLAVIGSNIATVSAGPIPGSTPMAVPMKQPISAHARLTGDTAAAKPPISAVRVSIMTSAAAAAARKCP